MTGTIILLAPATTESAIANGDTRTIHLHHAHTQEAIDATFMVDGQYDPAVLQKLNWFLRDWRREEATKMDPKLFDTIWEVYRESGSQQPIEVMSAYRSPETNAMLRRASRAVAEHSQHILGKAMDQHYVDVPMSRIREIAMRLQRGGVGFYPTAGTPFVHMDVGGVRHWPRMSYDQLARLFPDGKTVHIPSNGQPLAGYEEARAELEARGDSFNYPTAGEVKSKGFFAWLFGGSGDEEGDGPAERDAGSGRAGKGAPQRVASLDRNAVGTIPDEALATAGKNAGMRSFAFSNVTPAPEAVAPSQTQPAGRRRGRQAPVQTASLAPQQAEPSAAQAQQVLAQEMQRQTELKAAQAQQAQADAVAARDSATARDAATAKQSAEAGVSSVEPPAFAQASSARLGAAAADAPSAAPMPPRRPTELASAGPEMPLPPSRPVELMTHNDRAPTPGAAHRDAIAALTTGDIGRANLPAAITQGLAQPGGIPSPHLLSYAASIPMRASVPVPVARPQFVAARLDRSNFRSLTAATPASSNTSRSGLGSSVSALRPAARADLGALTTADSAGSASRFNSRATDLSTDRFSGAAVRPLERVSTATLHKPATTTTE